MIGCGHRWSQKTQRRGTRKTRLQFDFLVQVKNVWLFKSTQGKRQRTEKRKKSMEQFCSIRSVLPFTVFFPFRPAELTEWQIGGGSCRGRACQKFRCSCELWREMKPAGCWNAGCECGCRMDRCNEEASGPRPIRRVLWLAKGAGARRRDLLKQGVCLVSWRSSCG